MCGSFFLKSDDKYPMFFCVEQGGERKEQGMKVATTLRLPEEMKLAIEKEADRAGLSFNETVCVMLSDWLTNKAHRC